MRRLPVRTGASRISVPDPKGPWTGKLDWQRSETYALARCSGGEESVRRDRRHIRSDPRGTPELLVPLAGTAWVEQGPSSGERSGPGAMVLCDIDRPLAFADDASFLSVTPLSCVRRTWPPAIRPRPVSR